MLALSDARVSLAGVCVLRGLSLNLAPRARLALVGRNGAGKTTTLRALMGSLRLDSGELICDGEDLTHARPSRRSALGIGYAPEERGLFSGYSIEENLRLPAEVLRMKGTEIKARLSEVYEIVPELATLRTRPAGSVSGGQGKMVALGRALMIGTRFVLLDEPFQGLAPALALQYARALTRLQQLRADVSILITESNPSLLTDFTETTLTIERGEIVPQPLSLT